MSDPDHPLPLNSSSGGIRNITRQPTANTSLYIKTQLEPICILESDASKRLNGSPRAAWVCSGVGTPDSIDVDSDDHGDSGLQRISAPPPIQ